MAETKTKPAGRKAADERKRTDALPDPADVLPERAHADGCPIPPERQEVYVTRQPRRTDSNGDLVERARDVVVAHCVECGATRNVPDSELDPELVKRLTSLG